MDPIGWYIANLHRLLGHDKTAMVIGAPAYDRADCLICRYEREPTDENRRAVEQALTPTGGAQ